jgi:site-specific DNA-cytosine methylase
MGTEVKLKREAIERRIAELEGKMPDIQASKEGAEARATIRRLKARLKTYPQEPKKRIYKVKARFIFDGVFEIRAHTRKEAVQMAKIKRFMALYGIVDIKMRMLRIPELKRIMGFPPDYVLVGTQADQKKFIGNAVEVNMARVLCEALCARLIEGDLRPMRIAA